MYTIKLSNGTTLKNLELNGNNYISKSEIKDSMFDGGLDIVEIRDSETKETLVLNDAVLIQNRQSGDEWWFILAEKTAEQKAQEEISTTMTDVQMALAELYEMIIG